MELRTYALQNYRVFEHLELEVPAGLVGIYGPNGSGKSALLEAVTWALYGRARTPKQGIPTTGGTGECVVELGFDHDEHHYVIRRTISGVNHTVKARVTTAGQTVADGPAEVGRYVRSLLGMDEHAFRSSVFAEQKQLAAFSEHTADHRRRLVLSLLGITPIEKARDEARGDARMAERDYTRLTSALPDTDELDTRRAELESLVGRLGTTVTTQAAAFDAFADHRRVRAEELRRSEDAKRQDAVIRAHGQAARKERDSALARIAELDLEDQALAASAVRLVELEELLAAIDDHAIVERVRLLDEFRVAWSRTQELELAATTSGSAPQPPDPNLVRAAEQRASDAASSKATAVAANAAAQRELETASGRLRSATSLTDELPCPTCGQDIAGGVQGVMAHFGAEVELRTSRVKVAEKAQRAATSAHDDTASALKAALGAQAVATELWERSRSSRAALDAARTDVARTLVALSPSEDGPVGMTVPSASGEMATAYASEARALRSKAQEATSWRNEMARLIGRRDRLERLQQERVDMTARLADADLSRARLRAELDALAFDSVHHDRLLSELSKIETDADAALQALRQSEAALAGAGRELAAVGARLEQAQEQRAQLGQLATRAVLLGRTAEMLNGFRHAVVASVGPRLSAQASELFVLLTGGEYDGLHVDPESYEIQVIDQGITFPTARFSGSEVDLANLALRVAISEQVRFQAGGQIGLLVLDEALASLDDDRKDRMLMALTQLSARFRQILVVTHAVEVKEQLPQAIEIVKLGPRRSTARLVGGQY